MKGPSGGWVFGLGGALGEGGGWLSGPCRRGSGSVRERLASQRLCWASASQNLAAFCGLWGGAEEFASRTLVPLTDLGYRVSFCVSLVFGAVL